MGYQSNDPRWIETPVDTHCGRCGAPVLKGTRSFYYPEKQETLCNTPLCGHRADRLVQQQMRDNG